MALRQTLLTKLLSPAGDDENEESPQRIKLVDLTDPVLQSTGLDNTIMLIAMHDFMHNTGQRKMIGVYSWAVFWAIANMKSSQQLPGISLPLV